MPDPQVGRNNWRNPKWLLALALAAASLLLPRAARLNTYLGSAFLTAETYAMMLGILVSALLMARLDPVHRRRWALVIGLAPLVETLGRMLHSGPGNLWPIAIVLDLFIGLVPSFLGARLERALRPRTPGEPRTRGAT